MRSVPIELKRLIADYLFAKVETYNQLIPSEAAAESKRDMHLVNGMRTLCSGDENFLGKRFKISHKMDRQACDQARRNLVFSTLKFRQMHGKWFELPRLISARACLQRFIEATSFSDESFQKHMAKMDTHHAEIVALRRKQSWLHRLSKRERSNRFS
jgi:hypothetical protein